MINKIYKDLIKEFGDPAKYWPQWCENKKSVIEREKVVIGMVLVQRTSWHNANIALKNLKKADLLSLEKIANVKTLEKLTELVRPAGFFQSKPKRLFDICKYFVDNGGVKKVMEREVEKIREELLEIKGVGRETADTILLYALDKPVFIIDEYTRRFVEKHKLSKEKDYLKLQKFFEKNFEKDLEKYRNFHALIIISQRGREKAVMEVV